MKLKNILILVPISLVYVSVLVECLSFNHVKNRDPKREEILKKLPRVIKRNFKNWDSNKGCIERIMRSTAAKVKLTKQGWFRFTSRLPKLMTPLLKSQILLEFHKVEKMSQVRSYNYSLDLQPQNGKSEPKNIEMSQLIYEGDLAEFFFNITSIHYKLMLADKKYMRLRFHFLVTQGNATQMRTTMPFQYMRMKPYLITDEENKNCSMSILTRDTEKLLAKSKKQTTLMNVEKFEYQGNNSHYMCRLPGSSKPLSYSFWSSFAITPFIINPEDTGTCESAESNTTRRETSVCCASITSDQATMVLQGNHLKNMFIIKAENLIGTDNDCL